MNVSETIDKYLDLTGELEKLWNVMVMARIIVDGTLGMDPKRPRRVIDWTGDQKNRDHTDYSIVKIR